MTEPTQRNIVGELEHRARWTGYVVIAIVLGVQALIGTVLQEDGAADPRAMFISVLMFTWPLSLAVAVGVVGFARVPSLSQGWAPFAWFAGLAVAALFLAWSAGQVVSPVGQISANTGLPYLAMSVVSSIAGGFINAYGPPVFFGALAVGGGLAWMWLDVIDPRT